jgi:hypothetical protein
MEGEVENRKDGKKQFTSNEFLMLFEALVRISS